MQQTACVIEIDGSDAIVRGERASACGDCAGKASCSTLGSWNARSVELRVKNEAGARIGDTVLLEIPDSLMLKVAFRLYGVPMLLFVLCGLLGYQVSTALGLGATELWSGLAALAGVAVAYVYQWRHSRQGGDAAFEIRMLRICDDLPVQKGCDSAP